VIELAQIITLMVQHPNGSYPIHLGRGLLGRTGDVLRAAGVPAGGRVALVSNTVVAPLYAHQVKDALRAAGLDPFLCSLPDGEEHKTLNSVASLYDQFLTGQLDRSGTVLALGGGVTGDTAGFAAATFMRGVRFAQIPTTVLSMADASVGGKTGVDLPQGKNLVGAFKQPAAVVIDPEVLATLPAEEVRSGMAEVIKHGVISDPQHFAALESGPNGPLSPQILAQTVQVKIAVVEDDPYEHGRRATLNLGHTVGHGLEKLSQFHLRHGEAVAIGMAAAARIAAEIGWADHALIERIETALTAWDLPTRCPPFPVDQIWAAMAHDKKRQGRGLRWVLPRAIGRVEISEEVPPAVVHTVLVNMGAKKS
jgi:3-dehydroquinate synthase